MNIILYMSLEMATSLFRGEAEEVFAYKEDSDFKGPSVQVILPMSDFLVTCKLGQFKVTRRKQP